MAPPAAGAHSQPNYTQPPQPQGQNSPGKFSISFQYKKQASTEP